MIAVMEVRLLFHDHLPHPVHPHQPDNLCKMGEQGVQPSIGRRQNFFIVQHDPGMQNFLFIQSHPGHQGIHKT